MKDLAKSPQGQGSSTVTPSNMMILGSSDSVVPSSKSCLPALNDHLSVTIESLQSLHSGGLSRRYLSQTNVNSIGVRECPQSLNSLSNFPMQSRQWHASNQHFPTLHEHRLSTDPMVSSNPLLQMMEQRMAANAPSRPASPLHEQRCSQPQPTTPCNPLLQMMEQHMATTQAASNPIHAMANDGSLQALLESPNALRQVSSAQQLQLKAMMAQRMSQNAIAQQSFCSQLGGMRQASTAHHTQQNLTQMHNYVASTESSVLPRCAHSLSELERLRQENQLIQFCQQMSQEKSRRTSLHLFEPRTTLGGQPSLTSMKRTPSASSTTSSLGKRTSDDGSNGSMCSISSTSRKMHRSSSEHRTSLAGSDRSGSSDLLDTRIQNLSLNRKPQKKCWINTLLAQQSSTDDAPQAVGIAVKSSSTKPLNQVKTTNIISEVPDRIKYQNVNSKSNPIDVVKEALSTRGLDCNTRPSSDMDDEFFVKITEMYGTEVVSAIRSNNVESLRKLHADGANLQCGNQYGETLIHLACRRSHRELVSFLVKEAGVSLRVRDDFGRTPMHDVCWRATPDLELFDILLDSAPELLMLSDNRGHTPLDYARREHWDVLVPFLLERSQKFRPATI
jgi:hypothetical protein